MADNKLKGLVSDDAWGEYEASTKGNPYFHLDNLGDNCRGFLVKKSKKLDDIKTENEGKDVWQRVYTIMVPEGETYKAMSNKEMIDIKGGELMDVYGRMRTQTDGIELNIIASMEDVPVGQLIGFKFTEHREPAKKGQQGAKIVKGYKWPEVRKDLAAKAVSAGAVAADGSEDQPF